MKIRGTVACPSTSIRMGLTLFEKRPIDLPCHTFTITNQHLAKMPPVPKAVKPSASAARSTDTPPSSPLPDGQNAAMVALFERCVKTIELLAASKALPEPASALEPEASTKEDGKPKEPKSRASKLEYKKVNQV